MWPDVCYIRNRVSWDKPAVPILSKIGDINYARKE